MIYDTNLHILLYVHPEFILNSRIFIAGVRVNGTLDGYILLILPEKVFYVFYDMNNKKSKK